MRTKINAETFIDEGESFYGTREGTVEVTLGGETRRVDAIRNSTNFCVVIRGRVKRGRKWWKLRLYQMNDGTEFVEGETSRLTDADWQAFTFPPSRQLIPREPDEDGATSDYDPEPPFSGDD